MVAAPAASSLSEAYVAAMTKAAPEAVAKGAGKVMPGLIKTMAEGGGGGSLATGVETAARNETWKDGFTPGIANLSGEMFKAGVIGAGVGVVTHGAIELLKASVFVRGGATNPPTGEAVKTPPRIPPATAVDPLVARKNALSLLCSGSAGWEHWVAMAKEMGEHAAAYRAALLAARKQLAAEALVSIEAELERVGYTWALVGGAELNEPLHVKLKPQVRPTGGGAPASAPTETAVADVKAKVKAAVHQRTGTELETVGVDASTDVGGGGAGRKGGGSDGGGGGRDGEPPSGPPSSGGPARPVTTAIERLQTKFPGMHTFTEQGPLIRVNEQLDLHPDYLVARSEAELAQIVGVSRRVQEAPGQDPSRIVDRTARETLEKDVTKLSSSTGLRLRFRYQLNAQVDALLAEHGLASHFENLTPEHRSRLWDVINERPKDTPRSHAKRSLLKQQEKLAVNWAKAETRDPLVFVDRFQHWNQVVDNAVKRLETSLDEAWRSAPDPKPRMLGPWCEQNLNRSGITTKHGGRDRHLGEGARVGSQQGGQPSVGIRTPRGSQVAQGPCRAGRTCSTWPTTSWWQRSVRRRRCVSPGSPLRSITPTSRGTGAGCRRHTKAAPAATSRTTCSARTRRSRTHRPPNRA